MAGTRAPRLPRFGDLAAVSPESDAPPTLRSRGRRFAELVRIARANGLVPFRRLDFTRDPASSELRRTQAAGLRRALEQAGGAFVKMGQLLSTRDDLLPEEWSSELSRLQREVPPAPWDEVRALLERELAAPLDTVFSEFDVEPLAAASIAQVHRARLVDGGAEVAVKVQRPGIVPVVERDVDIALRVTRVLARTSSTARQLGVEQVAEQYAADLVRQVDFRQEAVNLAALGAMQARAARSREVRIPTLHETVSTAHVLVMEHLEGETLTAIGRRPRAERPDTTDAMRAVLRAFVRQVVFDGVYHSDLHPGNIMVLPDGTPALVDFGSVGRLDANLRESVQDLLTAYLAGDTRRIGDGVLALAPLPPNADEAAFRRDLASFVTYRLGPGSRIGLDTVDAAVEVFGRYRIGMPADFVAAARGFAILEGTARSVLPDFDILEESRSLVRDQIADQLRPAALRQLATTELLGLVPGLRKLPRRLDRITYLLESGSLNVNIRVLAERRDRQLLMALVRQLGAALVGVAAGIVGLVLLATPPAARPGAALAPSAAGTVLVVVALVALVAAGADAWITRRRG